MVNLDSSEPRRDIFLLRLESTGIIRKQSLERASSNHLVGASLVGVSLEYKTRICRHRDLEG